MGNEADATSTLVNFQIKRIVVIVAVSTLQPIRITARTKGALTLMQEPVIRPVFASNEVPARTVSLISIGVVNNRARRERLAHGLFNDEAVL